MPERSRPARLRCASLLLAGVLCLPVSGQAQSSMDDMFGVMFRMMLVMMNVMSDAMLGNTGPGSNWGGLNTFSTGMNVWPAWSGLGSPWSSFGTPWAGGWNGPFGPATGPWRGYSPQRAGTTYLLEGRWYGNSGEILTIRGNRFRLQTGVIVLTGTLRIANNLIILYSPQTNTVTRYTFVRNQSDLFLSDGSGAVLTFRRHPRDLVRRRF
jgi:hypothetical protein